MLWCHLYMYTCAVFLCVFLGVLFNKNKLVAVYRHKNCINQKVEAVLLSFFLHGTIAFMLKSFCR